MEVVNICITLREECRLRVFENRILRDENGEWRRLHNEELYRSPNIVRVIKKIELGSARS